MNQFRDGKKHGYWEESFKNGGLIKGNYKNGAPDGLSEAFYASGKLKCKFYS